MIIMGQGLAKRSALLLLFGCLCSDLLTGLAKPWKRHTIDSSSKAAGKLGADGVRLADVNGDGLLDITTGWEQGGAIVVYHCLLYTSPSPRDKRQSRMPSSA